MTKSAIDAPRRNAFSVDPEDLVVIGIDTQDGTEHPLYDERVHLPMDESLVRNIMVYGVIQAITVRKDGGAVEVVAGRRRVLHAREANRRLVAEGKEPVVVPVLAPRRGSDHELFGVALSENEQRRGDDILVKAAKAARYMEMSGHDEDTCAITFGVTPQTIGNWLKLLDLGKPVQKMVTSGQISATAAAKLASLPRKEQAEEAEKMIADGATTVREATARAARRAGGGAPSAAPGKRVCRKVIALGKAKEVDPVFLAGMRFAIGDMTTEDVAAELGLDLSELLGGEQ